MKKILHSDWLRAVQFFFNEQRNLRMANQIFCFQIKRTPWMAQYHGPIFPWLRDTRAFLLLKEAQKGF